MVRQFKRRTNFAASSLSRQLFWTNHLITITQDWVSNTREWHTKEFTIPRWIDSRGVCFSDRLMITTMVKINELLDVKRTRVQLRVLTKVVCENTFSTIKNPILRFSFIWSIPGSARFAPSAIKGSSSQRAVQAPQPYVRSKLRGTL